MLRWCADPLHAEDLQRVAEPFPEMQWDESAHLRNSQEAIVELRDGVDGHVGAHLPVSRPWFYRPTSRQKGDGVHRIVGHGLGDGGGCSAGNESGGWWWSS